MEKTFVRVHSIKDIVVFVSLLALGGILVAIPAGDAVNITGFFLLFAGAILALLQVRPIFNCSSMFHTHTSLVPRCMNTTFLK